jgi:hypothetical protein
MKLSEFMFFFKKVSKKAFFNLKKVNADFGKVKQDTTVLCIFSFFVVALFYVKNLWKEKANLSTNIKSSWV